MMCGFWLIVLTVAVFFKRRAKRQVRLLYTEQPVVRGDYAIFPSCGCRYDLSGSQDRQLCQGHQQIIAAEVAA